MYARDIMTKDVIACSAGDSLNSAAQKMWDGDIGCLPVVDAERRVIGIITDRDISMAAFMRGQRLCEIPVNDVMSRTLFTCSPNDALKVVERQMAEAQVRRMPVVDAGGRLVGMLAMNDIARDAAASHHHADFVTTAAAICAPRRPHAGSPPRAEA